MNELNLSSSPYLLQHTENPVFWKQWSDETFKKAESEDKPVFISIGYSSCHWCHVMAHESFEDDEVAKILNEKYVSIKVDREERPDVDLLYMTVCQMMTGQGGWPLTVFAFPDKRPFFVGTYFPKESRGGRPGLKDLLVAVSDAWEQKREQLQQDCNKVVMHLVQESSPQPSDSIDETLPGYFYKFLAEQFDKDHGGFGPAPKFPTPHQLIFLQHCSEPGAKPMLETTLTAMRNGGIWDHLGKGFHRYSTDDQWLLPHFEKMLYDNALLLAVYSEQTRQTQQSFYKEVASDIVECLKRQFLHSEGGYISAIDADSEGEEGKFYFWKKSEILDVLGSDKGKTFCDIYGVTEEGNVADEATQQKNGNNVLHLKESINNEDTAALSHLFEVREKRVKPSEDDKILTDWNGLVLVGLSKACLVLKNEDTNNLAADCFRFIDEKLVQESKGNTILFHRTRKGNYGIDAVLTDYAYVIWGCLEWYEVSFNPQALIRAFQLTETMIDLFWDEKAGGFHLGQKEGSDLFINQKECLDGAIPSANAIIFYTLQKCSEFSGDGYYVEKAESLFKSFGLKIRALVQAHGFWMVGINYFFKEKTQSVVTGNDGKAWDYLKSQSRSKSFYQTLLHHSDQLDKIPVLKERLSSFNSPETSLVYHCHNFTCKEPVAL